MTIQIINGDCRDVLRKLERESIDCVVTSPPYFGLRDYGTGTWVGGDPQCEHDPPQWVEDAGDLRRQGEGGVVSANTAKALRRNGGVCRLCGARLVDLQLGMEPTPEVYVDALVDVFRQVWRVLKPTGTVWLNLGDSYASRPNGSIGATNLEGSTTPHAEARRAHALRKPGLPLGLKHKDLMMMPARVALALQADGWWIRSKITWGKPNPMPESVTDRPTSATEDIYLLTKSERYYYNADAVREPFAEATIARLSQDLDGQRQNSKPVENRNRDPGKTLRNIKDRMIRGSGTTRHQNWRTQQGEIRERLNVDGQEPCPQLEDRPPQAMGRNLRNLWVIGLRPYSGAHFATFPPDIPEKCILAGCPEGGTVLDMFGGAATTGLVAHRLQRHAVIIELSSAYARLGYDRIVADAPLLAGDVVYSSETNTGG